MKSVVVVVLELNAPQTTASALYADPQCNKAWLLARPAIRRAHRRHMESFKRFAEARR